MSLSLFTTVLLDLALLGLCGMALLAFARLSATHPAIPYLVFHSWFISARAVAILSGAPTLFSWPGGDSVSAAEISRAVLVADSALVSMTCAWILARRNTRMGDYLDSMPLRVDIIRWVAAVVIPIGAVANLLWSRVPGFDTPQLAANWAASSFAAITQAWVGLALVALIYWYGFKAGLLSFLIAYFTLAAYQGNFRFRLLIPAILLLQIYVDRQGKRWPSLFLTSSLMVCALLFFPLKGIGQALQAGESVNTVWQNAQRELADVFRGIHPDEMILDEFATTLTLADRHGKLFWGRTYAGILTVVIPRQWWPGKPGLADFEREISAPGRPIAADGMVVTMPGEFYVNFSYPGVILLSFAMAYILGHAFNAAYRRGYFSVARFTYLLVVCNLIQVFRDGLISLFVFVFINMLPLMAIVLLHFVFSSRRILSTPILQTPRIRPHREERPVA